MFGFLKSRRNDAPQAATLRHGPAHTNQAHTNQAHTNHGHTNHGHTNQGHTIHGGRDFVLAGLTIACLLPALAGMAYALWPGQEGLAGSNPTDALSASQWMPADLEQAERATQTLQVALPQALNVESLAPQATLDNETQDQTASGAPEAVEVTVAVEPGDTLMNLLVQAGADRQDAFYAITAMEEVYDPRHIRPGFEIHLAFLSDGNEASGEELGRLMAMSFQPDPERDVEVERDVSSTETGTGEVQFAAFTIERELTLALNSQTGVITSSLYNAAIEAGVPSATLGDLIHIFSFDVDFQRQIREGDSFDVFYETYLDEEGNLVRSGDVLYASMTLSGRTRELYRFTPESGFVDYFNPLGESVRKTLMRTPIDGARLSSGFGMREHPILGYSRMHKGTDFAAPAGTPIYAAGDGVIEVAGRNGGYGNYIRIRHNSTYSTAYAHMSRFAGGMSPGARVSQGEIIGYVGTTGNSTGPHLHYEVLENGTQVNPLNVDLPSGEILTGQALTAFQDARAAIDQQRAGLGEAPLVASGTTLN